MDADWRSLLLEWQNEDVGENPTTRASSTDVQHEQPNHDSCQAACVYSRSEGADRFPERPVQQTDPSCRVVQPVLTITGSYVIESGEKEPFSGKMEAPFPSRTEHHQQTEKALRQSTHLRSESDRAQLSHLGGIVNEIAQHSCFPKCDHKQKPPEQLQHKHQSAMSADLVIPASTTTTRAQETTISYRAAASCFSSQVSEERASVPQQQWANLGSANPAVNVFESRPCQHFMSVAQSPTQEFREHMHSQEVPRHEQGKQHYHHHQQQQQPQFEIQTIGRPAQQSIMEVSSRPFIINGQVIMQPQAQPLQTVIPISQQKGMHLDSSLIMCPKQLSLIVQQLQIQQQLLQKQHQEILRLSENVSTVRGSSRIAPQAPDPKSDSVKTGKRIRDANLPKRPLTAYNLFFKHERARMLSEAAGDESFATSKEAKAWKRGTMLGKGHEADLVSHKSQKECEHRHQRPRIGFAEMAQRVAAKWKKLDERTRDQYREAADQDKERYMREKAAYLASKKSET